MQFVNQYKSKVYTNTLQWLITLPSIFLHLILMGTLYSVCVPFGDFVWCAEMKDYIYYIGVDWLILKIPFILFVSKNPLNKF